MQIKIVKSVAITVALGFCCLLVMAAGRAEKTAAVPIYRVDASWPKPLPNHWLMQGVPDLVVDKDDHIWVMNRPRDIMPDESGAASDPPRTDCCKAAPAVLEFDTQGNLIKGWGGPGYVPQWSAPGYRSPRAGSRARDSCRPPGECLGFRKCPRRQHHEVFRRREVALGLWPSWPAPGAGSEA